MKKVGIITFHNSYNCGSMMESFAIQKYLLKKDVNNEIIDFSNDGQRLMYATFERSNSLKNLIKNIILFPHRKRINENNKRYEMFKQNNFILSEKEYSKSKDIIDCYDIAIAGSDQIWNITIPDSDDAYFLNWCNKAYKVAYAPSFGAKNILDYSDNPEKYRNYLNDFDALSVRENNGKKWIKDLINKDVPVLIDPTLLLDESDYDELVDDSIKPKGKYIFFYSPSFDKDICAFVKKVSRKYGLKVIAWSSKSYFKKFIRRFGFELVRYESPSIYLSMIKNAELVFTTSFHGTIFSTVFRKKFFVIKNGGMYGNDDRVKTLIEQLGVENRIIKYEFNDVFDYLADVDYTNYEKNLPLLRERAERFLDENVVKKYNEKA